MSRNIKMFVAKILSSVTIFALVFSSAAFAFAAVQEVPVDNPALDQSCGLDIALVMDSSGSIDSTEMGIMKIAFKDFVNVLLPATPVIFSVVEFDSTASVNQTFTDDIALLETAIDSATSGGSTNWEDGLLEANGTFAGSRPDVQNLIVFASDGNPTVNNGNIGTPSATDGNDLINAVNLANIIKGDGTQIRTIGIGDGLTLSNLEDISGVNETYTAEDFDDLAEELSGLAEELCGGTITAKKIIDRDGDIETTEDQTPGEGWSFSIAGETGLLTDDSGKADSVEVDLGAKVVSETPQNGYTLIDAVCTNLDQEEQGTLDKANNSVIDINVNDDEIVSCVFYNQPDVAGLTVIKNLTNDNTGTATASDFNIKVTMAIADQEVPFDTENFPGDENGTAVDLPGDTYYVVTETNPGSYSVSYSPECSGFMAVDDSKICTITNNDLTPEVGSLTVVKVVINDDGGEKEVSDFPLFINAQSVSSGTPAELAPGEYQVSETIDANYNATFSGDCDSVGRVTLASGDSKTCTIINNDIDDSSNEDKPECSDGIDNDDNGDIDHPEDEGCDGPDDDDESSDDDDNNGGGGGGGSSSSGSRRSSGGSSPQEGQVLGAADEICTWDTQYLRRNWSKNVPDEVQTMQNFLNLEMNSGLTVDSRFGPQTEAAVRAFQMKYQADILTPWGINQPTGIWYLSTTTKAKEIMCGEEIPLPALINWSQNPAVRS